MRLLAILLFLLISIQVQAESNCTQLFSKFIGLEVDVRQPNVPKTNWLTWGKKVLKGQGKSFRPWRRLKSEPVFDANTDLKFTNAREVEETTLTDLGYEAGDVVTPSNLGATQIFQLLTVEGVSKLNRVTDMLMEKQMLEHPTRKRSGRQIPGSAYTSKFIHDFMHSEVLLSYVSKLAGVDLIPHPLGSQRAYLNISPKEPGQATDNFHTDGVAFVVVIAISDPSKYQGGAFQVFNGTKTQFDNLVREHEGDRFNTDNGSDFQVPNKLIVNRQFTQPGQALMAQGSVAIHRAEGIFGDAIRKTLVYSFRPRDPLVLDRTSYRNISTYPGEHGKKQELVNYLTELNQKRLSILRRTYYEALRQRMGEEILEEILAASDHAEQMLYMTFKYSRTGDKNDLPIDDSGFVRPRYLDGLVIGE